MPRQYAEKVFQFVADSEEFTFYCHSENTRNGFKHVSTMFDALGQRIGGDTRYYYNRTWERYGYQSTMCAIVGGLIESEKNRLASEWMQARGYVRMTAKRRAEYQAENVTSNALRTFYALRFMIGGHYKDERPWAYGPECGNRENAILDHVTNCVLIECTPDHKVYRIWNGSTYCDYDAPNRRFVG